MNQKGVRDHNERLILSVLQRYGAMPGSEIAKQTQLSAQTISVILRKLEGDGFVVKGEPVKGKVGKPSVPIGLNPNGALAFGVKIGRRSSEVFLMNLCGTVLFKAHLGYKFALPKTVFSFIRNSLKEAKLSIDEKLVAKICGIGVAAPFDLWKWGDVGGNTPLAFLSWKDISIEEEVALFSDLPVFMVNDGTSACWAEHVFGRGREFNDYAYFFVSTFIGGGLVLNQSVYEGGRGNAGALAPLRIGDRDGRTKQLLDVASIWVLEEKIAKSGHDPKALWVHPQDWTAFAPHVDEWIVAAANAIAQACVSVCAVIDFEAIVVDGHLPSDVRSKLVDAVRARLPQQDSRGLIVPQIFEGSIGSDARAIGAACSPMFKHFFLSAKSAVPD
ncbi:MAG: ROK family transcriptional regulator [Aliishimia sp.]